jgi:UDP-N-acetylglucosamine diphosphorylase/glucosamine-1-phosphate N-acetyltransferase
MSKGFVLYDDAIARAAEPFALTRPFGELRAGAFLVRERWERILRMKCDGFIGAPHLASFDEFGSPRAAKGRLAKGTIVVNSRAAPLLYGEVRKLAPGEAIVMNELAAGVALPRDMRVEDFADGARTLVSLGTAAGSVHSGCWMDQAWDLVRDLPGLLLDDASHLVNEIDVQQLKHVSVIGDHPCAVAGGAFVEPHVVVDTTGGPVVVLEGARIGAFTRLAGPVVIGEKTQVAGGRLSTVVTGENCRVCGEMSVVSVQGHANKGHDGFVGHSVIGRWANLGAGTTTSNLKNSYGKIRVQDSRGEHETGMQFLGTLIGDHAKTAIGTMLNTGTIVGAGANVFGGRGPGAYVAPFAWGTDTPGARYEKEKFLDVATHVMHRRGVELTEGMRDALGGAWDASQSKRGSSKKKTRAAAKVKSGKGNRR